MAGGNLKAANTQIPLAKPLFDEEMNEAAIRALQNERFVLGESVFKFEEEFAKYCGCKFGVATASGTAALTLSLIALGVSKANVITSPASFVASANTIMHAGAIPKFADINLRDYALDPVKARSEIDDRTRAILPIHLYGFPAQMNELCEIASEMNLAIIEDACQAHGASIGNRKVGSFGNVGCFSFYPSKNMTVGGDGGMIVTSDDSITEAVSSLRDAGRERGSKYRHVRLGFTERMNTVQAAIGRVQLTRLSSWNNKRRIAAQKYNDALSDINQVVTPPKGSSDVMPVYHMYVIRSSRRNELFEWLKEKGVECGVHYPDPIHLQPVYKETFGYKGGEFPYSEKLSKEALSLPMFADITDSQIDFIADSVREFFA